MQTSSVKCFGRERGMHQLIGKWYKFCQMLGRERGMHCPEGVQIHFHVCVLLCSAAAVCHHDLCWLLLCFIKYKSPRFFYFHVCVCVSVVALGGCCVPPWFVSCPFLALFKTSNQFFVFPCMCVVVLCGCCLPPWFVLAPSLFYELQANQGFYSDVCMLLCSVAAVCHHDLYWILLCCMKYKLHKFFYVHVCV